MTKSANFEAIENSTKLTWDEWVAYLESMQAANLPHKEIAEKAYEKLAGNMPNPGWWAQSVAVAYEQHIGRRQPGQRSDGTFECSVSKTVEGSMDGAIQLWLAYVKNHADFAGVVRAAEPTTTQSAKGRHWGCNLADGTRLNADAYPKSAAKTLLTITHQKFASQADKDRWQAHWKSVIKQL